MKPRQLLATLLVSMTCLATALASEAETSATAGSNRDQRNGTAAATARYEGTIGFARTNTRSGRLSTARGVAVGVDENGLSLSVSQALAPRNGPAIATNFNLSLGRDGSVSGSTGMSRASGPIHRSATASGRTGTGRNQGATSLASGTSDRFGRVKAVTRANDYRPRILRSHKQSRPRYLPVRRALIPRPIRP